MRNKYFFGLGTIGRDMFYTILSMYFIWFLTEILNLSDVMLAWTGGALTVLRIFDALNDPIMGLIVDNTNSRWGKFKPWILAGALASAGFMILLFSDLFLRLSCIFCDRIPGLGYHLRPERHCLLVHAPGAFTGAEAA